MERGNIAVIGAGVRAGTVHAIDTGEIVDVREFASAEKRAFLNYG